jgi:hypothetical protein
MSEGMLLRNTRAARLEAKASGSAPEAFVLGLKPRKTHARRLTRNTAAAQATMPAIATVSSRSPNRA